LFSWERFDGGDFSGRRGEDPRRQARERDVWASGEDFDDAGAKKNAKPVSAKIMKTKGNANRFSLFFRAPDGVTRRSRCSHRIASRSWPDHEIPALKRFHLKKKGSSAAVRRRFADRPPPSSRRNRFGRNGDPARPRFSPRVKRSLLDCKVKNIKNHVD
jgi:hypothetical protein